MDWDNEDYVLLQISKNVSNITKASDRLKNDLNFFLKALKIDNSIFDYAPKHIQDNKTFYKKAKAGILARPYIYLENLHEKFRDDKDIVLKAVGEYHIFIVDASPRLRKDYDVSMLAVEKTRANGDIEWLINELDDNLLKNPKFVLEAVSKNPDFIKFTDKSFRSDKKFMLSAIEIDPNTYKYADPVLKNDVDFVLDAIKKNPKIKYYPEVGVGIRTNPQIENLGGKITTIKTPYFPVYLNFTDVFEDDVILFKKDMTELTQKIKASKVPNFSKALTGEIFIGSPKFFKDTFNQDINERSGASYDTVGDVIWYYIPKRGVTVTNLIHEFGHKLHYKFIKDGASNIDIYDLFTYAKSDQCPFPKIGDPISDLREDWWIVKMASQEFYLNKIDQEKNYIYKNDDGDKKVFSYKKMIELLNCPSQYGATNLSEWFAEMCTLITLNKVKPSQQHIANMFIEILKK